VGCYYTCLIHISSMYSDYLYTNNVKVYEISASNYLYLHIVLSIYFRQHNLMMATWGPKHVVVVNSIPPCYLIKYLVVFMTVVHTYIYIVVDTQRGCHTLKKGQSFFKLNHYIKFPLTLKVWNIRNKVFSFNGKVYTVFHFFFFWNVKQHSLADGYRRCRKI
jgi:hypothetical protein